MKTETIDAIGAAAQKTTIAGAGLAGGGWLTANEIAALVGAMVAILGMMVSWYYKRQANLRLAAEHSLRQEERRLRMELMRATGKPIPSNDTDMAPLELDE